MLIPKIFDGGLFIDDRGELQFFNTELAACKRFYIVKHDRPMIRAWHGHLKEAKMALVTAGTFLVGAVDISKGWETGNCPIENVNKFVLSANKPQVLFIPPGYANGFKNLTSTGTIIFFSTSTLEESKDDDIRMPYDKWNIWDDNYR